MDSMPPILPIIISIIVISNIIKAGKAAKRQTPRSTQGAASAAGSSSRPKALGKSAGSSSANPKSWQIGKSNTTKASFNGKKGGGKAFGQKSKPSRYDSAFENKGLISGAPIAAFGDERDVISKESMAARNAEYIDVGNDYVSSFDVGGRSETQIGFDR